MEISLILWDQSSMKLLSDKYDSHIPKMLKKLHSDFVNANRTYYMVCKAVAVKHYDKK